MKNRRLRAVVATSLTLSILAALLPVAVSGPLTLVWALLCTGAIVRAAVKERDRRDSLLPWLAWTASLMTLGIVIRGVHGTLISEDFPMPSPADIVHFPAYCIFVAMMVRVHRARATRRDVDAWLDAAMVGSGILVVSWVSFYGDFVVDDEISIATRVLNAPYDVLVLGAAMLLLRITATPGARPVAYYLLGAACSAFFIVDMAASYSLARGTGLSITVALSPLVYGLAVAAAHHPSADQVLRPQREAEFHVGVLRLTLVGFAIAAPLSISLLAPDPSGLTRIALIAITVSLVVSVIVRVLRLLRLQERRALLEQDVGRETASLGALQSAEQIRKALPAALGRIVPRAGPIIFTDATQQDDAITVPASIRMGAEVIEFDARRVSAHERRLLETLVRDSGLLADSINGIEALARRDSESLANQKIAENERRFRALVQNSSDLVFVLDEQGHVSYASDSVANVTGHPIEAFNDRALSWILHENDVVAAEQIFSSVLSGTNRQTVHELRVRHADDSMRLFETVMTDMRHVPAVAGVVLNATDVTERRSLERDLKDAETIDPLTLLLNRNAFLAETDAAMRRASITGEAVTIAIIDLDDFKTINDALGPMLADRVLVEAAQRIRRSIRIADTVARLSGDEFGVLLPEGYSGIEAVAACERVLEDIAREFEIEGRTITPTATAGLATDTGGVSTAVQLLRHADVALTQAKTHLAGRALLFEESMALAVSERLDIRTSFQRALRDRELRLAYQPIVDFRTGGIVSLEALARWRHPERGDVSPTVFIPIAEDSNFIGELGEWALRTACNQVNEWADVGLDDFTVSVNMSGHQLREVDVIGRVKGILEETGVDPGRITIEITESVLIDDTDFIADRIHALRGIGLSLAIDDFGTGYSSLSYLQRYEFDILKIDSAFVRPLAAATMTREREIVSSIITLARGLGAITVAEGIEQDEEYAVLRTLGCDRAQGYLFYRPTEAELIAPILTRAAESARRAA